MANKFSEIYCDLVVKGFYVLFSLMLAFLVNGDLDLRQCILEGFKKRFHHGFNMVSLRPMFDGLHHRPGKLKIFGLQDLLAW